MTREDDTAGRTHRFASRFETLKQNLMSARDLQHGRVGFGELKTSRGYNKTLKTEASKLANGNG
jgi:hypothetical protein